MLAEKCWGELEIHQYYKSTSILFILVLLCYNRAYAIPRVLEREREREYFLACQEVSALADSVFHLLKSREPLQILWRFFNLEKLENIIN